MDAPDTGTIDTPFTVSITTAGGGCVSFHSTEVETDVDGADVAPYDRVYHPSEYGSCDKKLKHLVHDIELTFSTPGLKVLRIHALRTRTPEPTPFEGILVVEVR